MNVSNIDSYGSQRGVAMLPRWCRGVSIPVVTGLLGLFPALATAAPLDVEIERMLASHPKIESARQTLRATGAEIDSANAGYFPSIDFIGDSGRERVDDPVRFEETDETRTYANVELVQPLFDGFRTRAEKSGAEGRQRVASSLLRGTEHEMVLQGARAYLEILRHDALLELARREVGLASDQVELVSRGVRDGARSELDLLQQRLRYQQAEESRITVEQRLKMAAAEYESVFMSAPEPSAMSLPALSSRLPATLEEAMSKALEANAKLTVARSRIDVARAEKEVADSAYYPSVELVGAYIYEDNVDGVVGLKTTNQALVRMNWDWNLGGRKLANNRSAAERLAAIQSTSEATLHDVRKSVESSWARLESARQREQLAGDNLDLANSLLTKERASLAAGKGSRLDLLRAELSQLSADNSHVNAGFDRRLAEFELLFATGLL